MACEALLSSLIAKGDTMSEQSVYGEWVYWVTLDGDYARECFSADEAERVRLHGHGHVKVEERLIWRERTETQNVENRKGTQ